MPAGPSLRIPILNWIKSCLIIFFCFFAFSFSAAARSLSSDTIVRTVQWKYAGYIFTTDLKLSYHDYEFYHRLSKMQAYSDYAAERASHEYLNSLAKQLDANAQRMGYSNGTLVEYLVAFVQQAIPYKKDPYNNGHDYPKYPIETIIDQGGDCEDKSALLVSLLNTFGFDAIMIGLPGHMATALWSDRESGLHYMYDHKRYCYIETTSAWKIGSIPSRFKGTKVDIIEVERPKLYVRDENAARIKTGKTDSGLGNDPMNNSAMSSETVIVEPIVSLSNKKSILI
jgi:hypothetical protein